MQRINVMSLFDGIACGYQALKEAGIDVAVYYASEIDKNAIKIAKKNHPDIIELGDINDINFNNFIGKVDLIMGGSPCQDLSIAGKREGLSGDRSGLFYKFIEAIETIKPKYFLLENNVGMPKEAYEEISRLMGCYPVEINSALVSAQNRKRYYWTNIGPQNYNLFGFPTVAIPQPEDKKIILKDILESGYGVSVEHYAKTLNFVQNKSYALCARDYKGFGNQLMTGVAEPFIISLPHGYNNGSIKEEKAPTMTCSKYEYNNLVAEPLKIPEATAKGYAEISPGECVDLTQLGSKTRRGRAKKDKSNCLMASNQQYYQYLGKEPVRLGHLEGLNSAQANRVYSIQGKSVCLNANGGGGGAKTGLYKIDLPDGKYYIRKLTPIECERLQTLPDNYTAGIADSNRYKCIGNGWTVAVIAYIFSYLREETWN